MTGAPFFSGCASTPLAQARVESVLAERGVEPGSSLRLRPDAPETRAAVARLLAEPLGADAAARVALVNNRRLRASLAAASFAEADLWQAVRLPNPDVSGAVRFPAGGGPAVSTIAVGFNALDGLMIPLRRRLASEALGAAEKRAADEALALMSQVYAAWHTLAARAEWRNRLGRLHEEDEARAQAAARGAGPLGTVHARTQATETALELVRLDAQLVADRERLNVLLGLEGADAARWTLASSEPPVPASRPSAEDLERRALESRLDVAAARSEAALMRHAYELKRKTHLLPVGVEMGVESERERSGERLTGPTLKVGLPLFDQGQAELLRLRTAMEEAEDRVAALRVEAGSQVRVAAASVEAARQAESLAREGGLAQARRLWAESLRQSRGGGVGPLALHTARRELIHAERQAIEARRDYWLARAALARALGGGGASGWSDSAQGGACLAGPAS